MSTKVPRAWERSEFSTPHEASQVDNELLRQADRYDIYGEREVFIVRVLTRPVPLSADDFKAVMGASGDDAVLLEGSSAAKIVFVGRIEPDDAPSPHATIPDPCSSAVGTNPGCAAKIVSWHTKFFSRSDYEGKVPEIGDLVKVKISPGTFKYNLQYAYFDTLEAAGDAVPPAANCSHLDALFKGFDHKNLGTIIPPEDLNPETGKSDDKCKAETPISQIDWSSIRSKAMKTCKSTTKGCSMCACKIPDSVGSNWRSPQPTLGNLLWMKKTNKIKRILKYNGNDEIGYDPHTKTISGTKGVCVGGDVEKEYAKRLGMEYQRTSAHKGGQMGYGYKKSVDHANKVLKQGNTLVHCTHGADRTGMIVGAWIKSKEGGKKITGCYALWKYATSFNSWKGYICRSANLGFAAYFDALCPMTTFCNGDMYEKCAACKKAGVKHGTFGGPLIPAGWKPSGVNPKDPPNKCKKYPGTTYFKGTAKYQEGCWSGSDSEGWKKVGNAE